MLYQNFLIAGFSRYMKKKQPPRSFLQSGCSENFTHDIVPFWLESSRLQVHKFTKKVLHHHCFPNDFVKTFRTALTWLPKRIHSAKKILYGLQIELTLIKQMPKVLTNF